MEKATAVNRLAIAKRNSGKSYSQIASETGLTNVYVAQLFKRQAQLSQEAAAKLRNAVPHLADDLVHEMMMNPPLRSYSPSLIQDPAVYRLNEAVMHFGESIKEIINEDFGDGIMSAIDFYCSVDKMKGVDGRDRVVVTFDGKYLPFTEQEKLEETNLATLARQILVWIEARDAVLKVLRKAWMESQGWAADYFLQRERKAIFVHLCNGTLVSQFPDLAFLGICVVRGV